MATDPITDRPDAALNALCALLDLPLAAAVEDFQVSVEGSARSITWTERTEASSITLRRSVTLGEPEIPAGTVPDLGALLAFQRRMGWG
jgi:hypothetical protein